MIRKRERQTDGGCQEFALTSSWSASPFALSLLGGVLLWVGFPPLGWSWCVWFAPVPWLVLVCGPVPAPRRFYAKIWAGSVCFWLVMLQGIRLAHPANYLGLFALSCYLAAYLSGFVAFVRHGFLTAKLPLVVVAPIAWTALEFVRSRLFTGFSVALLGHTQAEHVRLIQIADGGGAYAVSFVVMLCAAGIAASFIESDIRRRRQSAAAAACLLLLTLVYAEWRIRTVPVSSERPLHVALLQGTREKVFEFNPELEIQSFQQYRKLMALARDASRDLDLIIWPESAFTELRPDILIDQAALPPPGMSMPVDEFRELLIARQQQFAEKVQRIAEEANREWRNGEFHSRGIQLLMGVESAEFGPNRMHQRNTALLVSAAGQISGRYFKMHPVMFGEYIPFGEMWPWLYRVTPMQQGLSPGTGPASLMVHGYRISPSICFESTVPHLIRNHVRQLERSTGQRPDLLVNVTDDGWFGGSSILDLQLMCAVFRAVELRRPFLVAANTGITAAIDGNGQILQRLARSQEGFALATVSRDGRVSPYELWGDLFPGVCLLLSLGWHLPTSIRRWWPSS